MVVLTFLTNSNIEQTVSPQILPPEDKERAQGCRCTHADIRVLSHHGKTQKKYSLNVSLGRSSIDLEGGLST